MKRTELLFHVVMSTNNNDVVSRLIFPESDQIQILVSRQQGQGRSFNGTDITVTAINRRSTRSSTSSSVNSGGNRGLLPLSLTDISRTRGRSPSRIPYLSRSNESVSSGVSSCGPTPTTKPFENNGKSPSPNDFTTMNEDSIIKIEEYLKNNIEFLTNFICKNIENEILESWFLSRYNTPEEKSTFFNRLNFGTTQQITRRALPQGLHVSLGSTLSSNTEGSVRWELARFISSVIYADFFILYLSDRECQFLRKFSLQSTKQEEDTTYYCINDALTVATSVAKKQVSIRISRNEAQRRFPQGLGDLNDTIEAMKNSVHILCLPIVRLDGDIGGVIELHRKNIGAPFTAEDEEIAQSYLAWGGVAFHYADLNLQMIKQKQLNEFLLNVVKSIFQDMVSMDSVIKKVMKFAQKLVDADRASLFLMDNKTKELYARIFDLENANQQDPNSSTNTTKEIRFAVGTGIAGQVASTGKPLSVIDAYEDARFNPAIDKLTGYRTKSILCMPIFIRAAIIGVVQLVNKITGDKFSKEDEESFEVFAVYCGLALHHAKLYDKIRRSEQKAKVAVEVLSYHNTCSDTELDKVRNVTLPQNVLGIDDFYFPPASVDELQKVHYSVYMFVDLFGLQRFDLDSLYRFAMTVKKNYRRVPYHNWNHGWTVANAMYCILKSSNVFRPLERLALYVGCLCHDLDHRGRSNKFLADTESPLASIYTTSIMEHHHFNQTVTILQQEGHNIFSQLSSEEYKQVLGILKHCILATDLSLFFPYKARVQDLIQNEGFSWGIPDHRMLAQAIAMTGADLCNSTKAWDVQILTCQVIFEEFYEQGDMEKSQLGRAPMPMMDRDKSTQQPDSQVGFMSAICIPCYDTLNKLIPDTKPLLEGCQKNLMRWKAMAEESKKQEEKIDPPPSQIPTPPEIKVEEKSTIEQEEGDE